MNQPPKPSPSTQGARTAREHGQKHVRALPSKPMQKAPWWDTMRTDSEWEYDRMEQAADARKAEREEGLEVGAMELGNPARNVGYGGTEGFQLRPVEAPANDDDRMAGELRALLRETGADDFSNVEITVKDGEVTLSGAVENRLLKYRCEEIAEQLDGVKDIHNRLLLSQ